MICRISLGLPGHLGSAIAGVIDKLEIISSVRPVVMTRILIGLTFLSTFAYTALTAVALSWSSRTRAESWSMKPAWTAGPSFALLSNGLACLCYGILYYAINGALNAGEKVAQC